MMLYFYFTLQNIFYIRVSIHIIYIHLYIRILSRYNINQEKTVLINWSMTITDQVLFPHGYYDGVYECSDGQLGPCEKSYQGLLQVCCDHSGSINGFVYEYETNPVASMAMLGSYIIEQKSLTEFFFKTF